MKKRLLALAVLATSAAAVAKDSEVPFPTDYRDWHHVKSMVIEKGHPLFEMFGGIHHLYANPTALEGYKAGRFPNGSIIVFELFEAREVDNALVEGNRKVVGVMYKDATKFAATGGWGFEGFGGGEKDKRVVGNKASTACFACHTSQQSHDYVFSRTRE